MKMNMYAISLLITTSLLLGCSRDGEGNSALKSTGTLIVRITDAPFPYEQVEEANVTIFKIDARRVDASTEEDTPDKDMEVAMQADSDGGSPFVVLMEEEVPMNLLNLTNGVVQELVNAEVPVGTYDLVRVYVKGVNVVLTDGTTFELKVPSGEQTGIKIFIEPELVVAGGLTSELLLDFDVSQSFVPKGNTTASAGITGFNFKPVIKASNNSVAGTLTGIVTSDMGAGSVGLEGAEVAVYQDGALTRTTFSDADGGYAIMGLMAGTYNVVVSHDGYEPSAAVEVSIVAANQTLQDFELEYLGVVSEAGDIFRLNAGGPAYSFEGMDWNADAFFDGGDTLSNETTITGTTDSQVYQTQRMASTGTVTYDIPVPSGTYDVNLHFAELFFGLPGDGSGGGVGSRIFNVDLENGQQLHSDLDIFDATGSAATVLVESFPSILVEDGALTITFTSVVDNAVISGIEITKL